MPVSHTSVPFGCWITKQDTAMAPGLPSYSPVSENIACLLIRRDRNRGGVEADSGYFSLRA